MASQHETETTKLRDKFIAGRDASSVLSNYPTAWPNAQFEVPDVADEDAWFRWQILPGESRRQDLGASHGVEHTGIVVVSVFTPAHEGKKANDQVCDDVDEIYFNYKDTASNFVIRTRDAYVNTVGVDGAWFQQNVVIPYTRESIRSS